MGIGKVPYFTEWYGINRGKRNHTWQHISMHWIMVPCFRDLSKIVCLLPHFSSLLHLFPTLRKDTHGKTPFHILPALWPENLGSFSSCSNLNPSKKWFWLALLRLYAYLLTKNCGQENWVLCLPRQRSCVLPFTFPFSRELEDFKWGYKPARVGRTIC